MLKLLSTVLAAVAIGATAAVTHVAVDALVAWRNTALRAFFARGLLQVGRLGRVRACGGLAGRQPLAPGTGPAGLAVGGRGRRAALMRRALCPPLRAASPQAYAAQLAISSGLALAAAAAVQYVAPRAAGGGVTWVMAWLNGNNV